ncbi:MAG: F0F1 ATP synthase subunit epsilon [Thermodesulfovibrionales bacterium]
MSEKIRLEIVTPHGLVFSDDVEEVTAAGAEGEFGVLPGHAPFVTTLKIGILACKAGGQTRYFFVNWGYAEVGPDKVLVLADSAEKAEDIDVERAKAAKARAEELLRKGENVDFTRAESALERSLSRLQVAEHKISR